MTTFAHKPSDQQLDIFHWFATSRVRFKAGTDGIKAANLVVRARAGTGKTTTIIEGVQRAPEDKILLAAFNKDIAVELQARVGGNGKVEAKTLHALGCKFVFRNWTGTSVDDTGKRAQHLAKLAADSAPEPILRLITGLHSKAREITPFAKNGEALINLATRFNLLPDEEWEKDGWDIDAVCAAAHRAMVIAKDRASAPMGFDFADMIYLPLVNNWVRPWFNMVVVDEAQDMTEAQLALATRACKRNGRICVVGDDRQAIYGFRGADSGSLDRLKDELRAEELSLTITRRCGKVIVNLAKELVPDFEAAPTAPDGEIKNVTDGAMLDGARINDFILSRTNAPLIKVCMALLKRGVRARIKGRDIGRGLQALVKKLAPANPGQLSALLADWAAGERERAAEKLTEDAANERIEFINDQVMVLEALAEGLATMADLDTRINELFADNTKGAVMCSTVHRAKGLEADQVWLLEGTFRRGGEEDNIRYVGITRAKTRLRLVSGFERAPKGGNDEGPAKQVAMFPNPLGLIPDLPRTEAGEDCARVTSGGEL